MKKIGAFLLYGGGILFAGLLVCASLATHKTNDAKSNGVPSSNAESKIEREGEKPVIRQADKIQVFLFHTTHRCYSCITIGQFAKKTVEQKFPDELKSGRIEFREINIDLSENKELADKFRASGSSLFLNPIVEGTDNIEEDTRVWRLVSDEQAFISYLSDKLKAWL